MNSLLFSIVLASLLSTTSLLAILFRVSPLLSPAPAISAFFASLFLSIASVGTLLMFGLWRLLPLELWDEGKLLSIALRQGLFLATGTTIVILFHLLGLLTWWIAILIYLVFILIEAALHY